VAIQGPAAEKGAKGAKPARPVKPVNTRPSGGTFVGVDIGTQQIKVVEVRGYGPGLTISGYGIGNTPPGAIQNGRITDPKALGAALKAVLLKSGVKGNKVVASVGGNEAVVVRVIEVPRMLPGELKEAMKYEVERSIPFAINQVEMDYNAIDDGPPDPSNPNMEVLFAAAQRDMVMALMNTLIAAGLDPKAIDIEPLAVGRSLVNLSKQGLMTKNVVVVNIGASLTEVAIFKNGLLRFPRTIPIAGDNFTRSISDQLGLSMDAAEDEKRNNATVLMEVLQQGSGTPFPGDEPSPFDFEINAAPPVMGGIGTVGGGPTVYSPDTGDTTENKPVFPPGDTTEDAPVTSGDTTDQGIPPQLRVDDPFASADSYASSGGAATPAAPAPAPDDPRYRRRREVFDAIYPVLSEFAMEVRRSVDYFRSKYPSDTVDLILLCGGSAKLGNLDQFIAYEMGIPTEVADPLKNVNNVSGKGGREEAPAYAIALGLAARDAIIGSGR
jgi:type IV pilus assembly protein PilM